MIGTIETEDKDATAKRLRDFIVEVQSSAFNHAQTYTTVVIFGGYAGLFTIWSFTAEHLSQTVSFTVALLIGVSLLTFVLFEIFRMVIVAQDMMELRGLILRPLPPDELFAQRERLAKAQNRRMVRIVLPTWVGALVVTVITAIGAAAVMLFNFASGLWPSAPVVTAI